MHADKVLVIFVFLVVFFGGSECWRSSPSRPSPSRPSPSRPFPRPSPTFRPFPRPSPTFRPFPRPSPTFRPFPQPTFRPFPQPTSRPFPQPTSRPFPQPTFRPFPQPTSRPFPQPTFRPVTQSPTYRPFPTRAPTYRPFPAQPSTYRPFPSHTSYTTPRYPVRYPTPAPKYPTQPRYPIGPVGPRPSYPGYGSGGVFQGRPYQPSYTVPVRIPSPGGSRIKVYNVNNYHPSSYWAPPSYPVYRYSYRDTGSSALGFYLGYSLGRISTPTYYHHHGSFYDGYSPRYDHYTVHHYYHNTGSIPKEQTVSTKVIIQCGDGSQICPANTTALCTANGQIMCVVVATQTVPCKQDANLRCVQSMVPCENNDAPECKGIAKGQTTSIDIPCISNTAVEGNITTVNNTIISAEQAKNITTVPLSATVKLSGLVSTGVTSTSNITTTPVSVTTMPTVETTTPNATFPSLNATRTKRSVPQYCVTIVAEPSKRAPTEGEQVFKEVSSVFEKFFSKAFGMDKNTVPDL